jgi:hypothetical protein
MDDRVYWLVQVDALSPCWLALYRGELTEETFVAVVQGWSERHPGRKLRGVMVSTKGAAEICSWPGESATYRSAPPAAGEEYEDGITIKLPGYDPIRLEVSFALPFGAISIAG